MLSPSTSSLPRGESSQLLQLTALRFFAALSVLIYHSSFLRYIENPLKTIASTVFDEGYAGVPFFFVLSGFILSHTYHDKLGSGHISSRKYLLLRIARIFPLHVLIAALFVIYTPYGQHSSVLQVSLNALLLQSWIPNSEYYFSLNGVSWSLSVELFFYSSFIFLVKLPTKWLMGLVALWATVITLNAVGVVLNHGTWIESGKPTLNLWLFCISPVTRLLEFMIGILTHRLSRARAMRKASLNECLAILGLMIAIGIFSVHKFSDILRYQLLYLPVMTFLIYSFAPGQGILSELLKRKGLVLLGEASFSLYMIHQPIINMGYEAYLNFGFTFSPVILAILLASFCVTLSVVIYKFLERPMYQYLRNKILNSREPSQASISLRNTTAIEIPSKVDN